VYVIVFRCCCVCAVAGEALLFLMPSEEEGMLAALKEKKVPIKLRSFSARKVLPVKGQFGSLLAEHEDLKQTAQAAFLTYMRSVYLNPRRDIFDISKLDPDAYASSMGLLAAPHQRAVNKMQKHAKLSSAKNAKKPVLDITKETVAVAGGTGWQTLPCEEQTEQVEEGEDADQAAGGDGNGDRGQEAQDKASLDGSGSGSEQLGSGRGNGALGLAMDQDDAEEGTSGEDEDDGCLLSVRRKNVLQNLDAIEDEAARHRYHADVFFC
jgi:hypothetical protein